MQSEEMKRIAVIGAGLMGHGIAQEFAVAGFDVVLQARSDESLSKAIAAIRTNLAHLVQLDAVSSKAAETAPGQIELTTDLEVAAANADIVIESVYEDLELKQRIFAQLDDVCPEQTILASNTSSFMPSQMATDVRRRSRLLGTHFFNPPYLIPLVEIVRGQETSDEVVKVVQQLLQRIGKRPVVVQKEVPGFIGNRFQAALLREALWLVQRGVATPQDIDTVIKTSIGRRWAVAGVFEVFDLGGWDVVSSAASAITPHLETSTELPPILTEKLASGDLGVKTGKGFYEWTQETAAALNQRLTNALVQIEKWT